MREGINKVEVGDEASIALLGCCAFRELDTGGGGEVEGADDRETVEPSDEGSGEALLEVLDISVV